MIIFPAIELHHGRCVEANQGYPKTEAIFRGNPATIAQHWVAQGAEWLHIVNLDGPLEATKAHLHALHRPANIWIKHPGRDAPEPPDVDLMRRLPVNLQQLRAIRHAVSVPIQFGGGLRTLDDIQLAIELGADRIVLGTVALEKPDLVEMALQKWGPERIMVAIDANKGKVTTHSWETVSDIDAVDLGHRMYAIGIRRVIYTDIQRNGTLSGVNLKATMQLGDLTSLHVVACGGVADIEDIRRLKSHEHYNIDGVVVGRSIYTGTLSLPQAIALGHQPLKRSSAGIIPFRYHNGQPEFLLLFNLFFEQWQFPRGGVEGELCNQACAVREFEEETGLSVKQLYDNCRTELDYVTKIRDYEIERKIVYYLAEVNTYEEVRLGHENHCEARWSSANEAWELLTDTAPEQLPALDNAMAYLHGMTVV